MPIQTDLNVSPYFDDYDEKKDYYKILFRPSTAVQIREINQLQTILQKQIERFGDNVYKRGTIIDGCNFIFHNPLPYVKINDVETDNTPVNVTGFKGYFVKNIDGLIAQIVETSAGFESSTPNLNTLFLKYTNHGNSGSKTAFEPNQILTIYDPSLKVIDTDIFVKSAGFSNTDIPVFLSAITVSNTTGGQSFTNVSGQACTFVVGDVLTQEITGAQAEIREINTTANNTYLVLKIRPLASQLRLGNTSSWSFIDGYNFTSSTSKITANLTASIGSGANGSIITDLTGGILTCSIISGGSNYYVEPYVSVAYSTPTTNVSYEPLFDSLNISAKTYAAKVTVNFDSTSVGNGYGMSVSDGIIYQKGFFSRVDEDFIVVEKYSTSTNNVVGFDTTEEIIDYRTDTSLYDNATGTLNYNAPGASRLKLTPKLVVLTSEEAKANTNFFTIVEFSEGRPTKQNSTTKFNSIAKDIAQRSYEESGNFVIDQFLVTTKSTNSFTDEAANIEVQIDPGLAYINGYRVQRNDSYSTNIRKGTDTVVTNTSISLNYGNYIKVNQLGGMFKFSVGATISLRDTAKNYLTTGTYSNITAAGTEIGTARIRSVSLMSGSAGSPNAEYWIYLFDIRMNPGRNFHSVRSIFYSGASINGTADIILVDGIAQVYDPQNSTMIFNSGNRALKNANNLSYTYRSVNDTVSCNTQGFISISVSQNPGEYFPYVGNLSETEKLNLVVVPFANAIATANAPGQLSTSTTSTTVTGTATTFLTSFTPGDHIRIANLTTSEFKRIVSIANNTSLVIDSNSSYSFTGANSILVFPQNIPIPLFGRTNRVVSVDANTTLLINLGNTITSTTNVAVSFEAQRNVISAPKSVTRKAYVRIRTSNNVANNIGPWCLGLPDIIRLNNVYLGNSTTVSITNSKVTSNFWIDHNQRKDYYDVGFLFKTPNYSLPSDTYLLVDFDVLRTTDQGLKTVASYPINDTTPYSNSISTINTVEIPEMYHDNGQYYDIRDHFDFRPFSTNTAVITTDATLSTINPEEPTQANRFNTTIDKKFPAPQSDCSTTLESYLGRIDSIVITANNDVSVIQGQPSLNPISPSLPNEGLYIDSIVIPPYPSLPSQKGTDTSSFLNRKIASIKYTNKRQSDFTVRTPINPDGTRQSQPKRYTMADIGKLEKRISDLEYYTALSFTENTINNLQIASSANSATNRFKFGFFVDNFTTINFSDIDDPRYNAQIYGNQLQPRKEQFNCRYKFNTADASTAECIQGNKVMLPSTVVPLVSQTRATEPTTVDVSTTVTRTSTTGTATTTTTTTVSRITTTEYELITRQNVANAQQFGYTTIITNLTPGSLATGQKYDSNWYKEFEVGKNAGTIFFVISKQKEAPLGSLWRKINGTWTKLSGVNINMTVDRMEYEFTYNYVPNSTGTDRLFRIFGTGTSGGDAGKDSYIVRGTYPRTSEVQVARTGNVYSIDQSTNTRTVTSVTPVTIEATETQTITNSLFNSGATSLLVFDRLFNQPATLNSPYVDLAQYIQTDLGNNT